MTNEEKLDDIKKIRDRTGGNYNNQLLIIIADELIKMNDHFLREEHKENHIRGV